MKLLARYLLEVYDDGSVKMKSVPKNDLAERKASSSILQIEAVVRYVMQHHGEAAIRNIVVAAEKHVAQELGIMQTSVHAKLTRYLGMAAEEIQGLLNNAVAHKQTKKLESLLLAKCEHSATEDEDKKVVLNLIQDILKR